jgi:hypothetical protein
VCLVQPGSEFNQDGELFCSEACATQHTHGEPCPSPDCHCEHGNAAGEGVKKEDELENALEETFPASDPISP